MAPILALLFACVTPDPPPPVPVGTTPPAAERGAKSKERSKGKSSGKAAGKAPAKAPGKAAGKAGGAPAKIGVAGPGVVEMTVEATDATTTFRVQITFSDGSSHSQAAGSVTGTCAEVPVAPVTHGGRTLTPLFSYQCTTGTSTLQGHVAQVGDQLMVVQLPSPEEGGALRVLQRVGLVPGVVLSRKA
jgi:hypothetical protein